MGKTAILAALALWACAEEEPKNSTMLVVPTTDTGAGGTPVDAFQIDPTEDQGVEPDPDEGVAPDPDEGVLPDPDEGVLPDPDEGVVPPRLEGAVATVTLVQQPEEGQITVAVTELVEPMPAPGDCQVVRVDPNDPPPVANDLDAGDITVEGARGGPFTFRRVGRTYQADRPVPATLFGNGDTLRAQGAGPLPFDLQVPAPAEVVVQSPGGFAMLPANADLTVRWNAGNAEAVLITVIPVGVGFEAAEGDWVFCGAADTGSFTVRGRDLERAAGAGIPGLPNALVAVTRIRTVSEDVGTSRAILTATTSNGSAVVLE